MTAIGKPTCPNIGSPLMNSSPRLFRLIQSRHPGYQAHSKNQWIAAIRKVYRRNGDVLASHLQHSKYQHLYNQGVWICGDWYSAVAAAGLDPEQRGLHTFWDKERVIREIKELKRRRIPLYAVYVMRNHPELFSAANRQYRS
jgi:hypothetical protein